ncbi:MAG TPA: hypothetical protein VFR15_03905, partial [Chloroflexia bacterium]|nr:hypothetical protein [Chloroflexia bacterium]
NGNGNGHANGEAKAKRGRKPRAKAEAPEDEIGSEPDDLAAGAEDQQPTPRRRGRPPKDKGGRDHLRLVK